MKSLVCTYASFWPGKTRNKIVQSGQAVRLLGWGISPLQNIYPTQIKVNLVCVCVGKGGEALGHLSPFCRGYSAQALCIGITFRCDSWLNYSKENNIIRSQTRAASWICSVYRPIYYIKSLRISLFFSFHRFFLPLFISVSFCIS
jgi:hypothetical protein